jgi:hypothetical protein
MNHRVNALLHAYPRCPECGAFESTPCRSATGVVRSPHKVRLKVADGSIIVINVDDARLAKKIRAARELGETVTIRAERRRSRGAR